MNYRRKSLKMIAALFEQKVFDGAATLSFYLLFSIFPIFLLAIQLGSLLYINNLDFFSAVYKSIPKEINEVVKSVAVQVSAYKTSGFWGFSIFLFSLWSTINTISAIIRQFNDVYKIEDTRSAFMIRFSALKILFLFILLVFVPYATFQFLQFFSEYIYDFRWLTSLQKFILHIIKHISLILTSFIFSVVLFKTAINKEIKLKKTLLGAGVTTALIAISTNLFGYYINHFTDYSILYGGFGAAMLLLTWLYLIAFSLIAGCTVNFSYYENLD